MDFKLNLLTPSLYSKEGETNCVDTLVEKFANYLKHRADNEFSMPCRYNKVPGLAFIHSFEDFEERFLIHSEYAVIIASPYSQNALNRFNARLLVFLTAKPTWQNRFLFVFLGNVKVMSNLVLYDPIYFSLNDWETLDDESWITLFNMIKITWKPHIEEVPLVESVREMPIPDQNNLLLINETNSVECAKQKENTQIKSEVRMLETRGTQGPNVTIEHSIFNPVRGISKRPICMDSETNTEPMFTKLDSWKQKENTQIKSEVKMFETRGTQGPNVTLEHSIFNPVRGISKRPICMDSEINTEPMFKKLDSIPTTLSDNSDSDSEQTFNCRSGTLEMNSKLFIQEIGSEEHLHQIVDASGAVDIDALDSKYSGKSDEIIRNNETTKEDFIDSPMTNLNLCHHNVASPHSHGPGMIEAEEEEVMHNESQLEDLLKHPTKTIFEGSRDADLEVNPTRTSKHEREIKNPENKSDEKRDNTINDPSLSFDFGLASNTSLVFPYVNDHFDNCVISEGKTQDRSVHEHTIGKQDLGLITTSGFGKSNKDTVEELLDDITLRPESTMENFESEGNGAKNELFDINPSNVDETINAFNIPVSTNSSDSFLNVTEEVKNTKDITFTPKMDLDLTNKVLKSEKKIDNETSESESEDLNDYIYGVKFKMGNFQEEESHAQNALFDLDSSDLNKIRTKENQHLKEGDLDFERNIYDVKTKSNTDNKNSRIGHAYRFENRRDERSNISSEKVTPNVDFQVRTEDISEISTEVTYTPRNEPIDEDVSMKFEKDHLIQTHLQPSKLDPFINAGGRENVENINYSPKTDQDVKDENLRSGKRNFNEKTSKRFDNETSESKLHNLDKEVNRDDTVGTEYAKKNFETGQSGAEDELCDINHLRLDKMKATSDVPVASTSLDSMEANRNLNGSDLKFENSILDSKAENEIESENSQLERGYRFANKKNERSDEVPEKLTPNKDSRLTNRDISETPMSADLANAPPNESIDADVSRKFITDSLIKTPLQRSKFDPFTNASVRENVENVNSSLKTDQDVKDENLQSGKKVYNEKTEKKLDNEVNESKLDNVKEEINLDSMVGTEYSVGDFEAEISTIKNELFDLEGCALDETIADSNVPVVLPSLDSFFNVTDDVKNTETISFSPKADQSLKDKDLKPGKKNRSKKSENKINNKSIESISRDVEEEVNHDRILEAEYKMKTFETENNATKNELFNVNTRGLNKREADQNLTGGDLDSEESIFQMGIKTQTKMDSENSGLELGSISENKKHERNNIFLEKITSNKDCGIKIQDISETHISKESENASKSESIDADLSVEFEKDSFNKMPLQGRALDSFICASNRETADNINSSLKGNTEWKDGEQITEMNIHDRKSEDNYKKKGHNLKKEIFEISDKLKHVNISDRHGSDSDNIISQQISSSPNSSQTGMQSFTELENSSTHDSLRLSMMSEERPMNISGSSPAAISPFCHKENGNIEKQEESLENLKRVNSGTKEKKGKSNSPRMESDIIPEKVDSKENQIGLGFSEIETQNTHSQHTATKSESQITNLPPDGSSKHDYRLLSKEERGVTNEKSTLHNLRDNDDVMNNDKACKELTFNKYDIMEDTGLQTVNVENENQINDISIRDTESRIMKRQGDYTNSFETTHHRVLGSSNIIFRNIQLFSSYLWTRVFSDRSSISSEISGDESITTRDFVPGYIHSPWYVVVLFITGTFVSRYWFEWSRGIFPTSVNPNTIIEAISSSVIHEEAVNRKWAIISSDHEGSIFLGDSANR